MPDVTSPDSLPSPTPSEPPNGPAQIQALATATQAMMTGHRNAADPHPLYLTASEADGRYTRPADVEKVVMSPLAGAVITWGEHNQAIANAIAVGGASAAFTVTLPGGAFSQAPNVVLTMSTVVGGTAGLVARVTNVTKTAFDVVYYNLGSAVIAAGTVARCNWQAVGY